MSPPTNNGTNLRQRTDGFVGSSSSSTGTVPRVSDSRMNGGGVGGVGGGGRPSEQPPRATNLNPRSLRQQSQQLERLLMEQQAKLMSLGQQNSNDQRQQDRSENPKYLTESLQDLKEKLELLQSFNSSSHSENHEQQQSFDFQQPQQRPSRYDNVGVGIVGQSEFLNNMQRYHHHQNRPTTNFNPLDQLRSENSKLKLAFQQQQEHVHQLTQSLNQCFQAVLTIQRDVTGLQQAVAIAATSTQNQGEQYDTKYDAKILILIFIQVNYTFGYLLNFDNFLEISSD